MNEQNAQLEPKSLDAIYNLAQARLDAQSRDADAALNRLSPVWSAAGVILAIVAGFISFHQTSIHSVTIAFSALCAVTFFAIMVLGFAAYIHIDLEYPPRMSKVWEEALFWESSVTKRQILAQTVQAIEFNRELIRRRTKFVTLALYLLPCEVIFAVVGIIPLFFSG